MIRQIFKIIWNEKRANVWIVSELILIFTILWFCCDYLCFMGKQYLAPKGFDIEHTYNVTVGLKPATITGEVADEEKIAAKAAILERIKTHPAVESATISNYAYPYTGSWASQGVKVDSAMLNNIWVKLVSPEFFDVFKINIEEGRRFNSNDVATSQRIVIGYGTDDSLRGFSFSQIDSIESQNTLYHVIGLANKVKRSEYDDYAPVIYHLISPGQTIENSDVSIRVKAELDHAGFADEFIEAMREPLEIDPYFLVNLRPLSDARSNYFKFMRYENGLKSTFSIAAFLLVNIFLGVIGTFWFRTQSRRSEIGLRMALGASRNAVKGAYLLEAIALLLIAGLVAVVLAINILTTGILDNLGLPMMREELFRNVTAGQFVADFLITFGVLAALSVAAVLYPAGKAVATQPADALRDE
jgi:putative ABC transport system permease protein